MIKENQAIFNEIYIEKYKRDKKKKQKLPYILKTILTVLGIIALIPVCIIIGTIGTILGAGYSANQEKIKYSILKDEKQKELIYKISKECQKILKNGIDKDLIKYLDIINITDKQIYISKNENKYNAMVTISGVDIERMLKDCNALELARELDVDSLLETKEGQLFESIFYRLCDNIDIINSIIEDQKEKNKGLKFCGIGYEDIGSGDFWANEYSFIDIKFPLNVKEENN